MRYIMRDFIIDLIATIPFSYLQVTDNDTTLELLQLLKLLRLRKLLITMNASAIQNVVKAFFRWRLSMIINNANKIKDPSTDHNQIML